MDFEKDFPDAKVIKLEQNYRSYGNILAAAHSVIRNNRGRKQKKLWTSKEEGDKIIYRRCDSDKEEAYYIAQEIDLLKGRTRSYDDFAVLYRTNAQSRLFEDALKRRGIPYQILSGFSFYDRKETKDMICYMRLVVNPADDLALKRIINEPKRGIGATTLDEYRKNIEKDGALERRFQKVIVDPTTAEETLQILKNIKPRYEEHHNVCYTDEALNACVKLTERYISDRNFPDKAIDALDEAGSRVHISNIIVPKSIEELEAKIEETKNEKLAAVKSQNFELAASFRDKERQYLLQLEAAKAKWEQELQEHRETVDEDKVAEVVAMMSGVPVQRIAKAENAKLLEMNAILKQKVVGQDEAIDKIVKAIQRNRVGLKDPNKPIGTFMFLGPTGVGKTHLAKKLAEYLFDSPDALIRIDMSEYLEKFSVSRLIGAPPGYVGYEEGGQLTEKVRRKPYSVVLLDEIEKAHPDVFNLLLQVFDEGRLTDSLGRRIDFKNTILIMTSNVGTRQLKDFGRGVGFNTQMTNGEPDKDFSRGIIQKALNKAFAPEFLNRIDDIIMFDQLDKAAIHKIIDIELKGLYQRVESLGYKLSITDEAKDFIATKGYDVQFGARPLKRAIQKYLEDEMAEMIIRATVGEGDLIVVDFDKEEQKIITSIQRQGAIEGSKTPELPEA